MIHIGMMIKAGSAYINTLLGGNQFASGIIIGGIGSILTYMAKDLPRKIFWFCIKHSTTKMSINSSHESFYQVMKYLSRIGLNEKARTIRVTNGQYGQNKESVKEIGYGSHILWINHVPIHIDITVDGSQPAGGTAAIRETLTMTKFGRSYRLFDKIILDSKEDKDENLTKYYSWEYGASDFIASQSKVDLSSVVLPKESMEYIKNGIDSFMEKEEWYVKNHIPYQLGILLYGPPGTGKTSLVRAIAGYCNRGVVQIGTVNSLADAAKKVPKDKIICVEEVDTLGLGKRDQEPTDGIGKIVEKFDAENTGQILGALDGLVPNHGRIIVMTTNYKEKLDDALIRPGRIDMMLLLGYVCKEQFSALMKKFFGKEPDLTGREMNENVTPAEIQKDVILGATVDDIIQKYTTKKE